MKERFMRFMAGRNGNDQLNSFLLCVCLVLIILGTIFKNAIGSVTSPIVIILLVYTYFRMLSRNLYKRSQENSRFLGIQQKVLARTRVNKERWVQRKEYKFFTCPSCKATLRVPRGHGKLKIVCRKCGTTFIGKS